jgi:thiol-disulfide isomerase/thioredoxin
VTRVSALALAAILIVAGCSGGDIDVSAIPELPATSPEAIIDLLVQSDRPVVLNVWASWCIPCRSEAPLLSAAAASFSDQIRFVGINVRDDQQGAREFIAEFGLDLEHYFDPARAVPPALGGSIGVPLTFFFAPGGDLVGLHAGIIDERTLALQIDELLAR